MAPRIVRRGEHLDAILYRHGVDRTAWSAPSNERLRATRGDGHVLAPGDVLELPEPERPTPTPLRVGAISRFTAVVPNIPIELAYSRAGAPIAGEPWHIEGYGEDARGVTDADGKLTFEVRVTTPRVTLVFERTGSRSLLEIGGLDPIQTTGGLTQRLRNLGFAVGEAAGRDAPELRRAITDFQVRHKLAPTGEPNAETLEALHARHGS
ncbi:MAG: peptidoglycan-binding domain-containing protein [Polyangiaceae bacterium]